MKLLSSTLLDELAAKAAESPRLRTHHDLHASRADPVQRFFVVAVRDSYFRPHRHASKLETVLVLRGALDLVTFDASGAIVSRDPIGEGAPSFGYETPAGTWHTVCVRSASVAFFEVKAGPYDPATAADAAPWAPAEGDPAVRAYLEWLRRAAPGGRGY